MRIVCMIVIAGLTLAAFPPANATNRPEASQACLDGAEAFRAWLDVNAPPAPEDVLAWMARLAEPCGYAWAPVEVPEIASSSGSLVCEGAGAGGIGASIVVLGTRVPLDNDAAVGDMTKTAYSSMNAEGAVYGMSANSAGAGAIRIGPVAVPADGDATVVCGEKTSQVCKKVWFWEFCADLVSLIACSAHGEASVGAKGIVTLNVSASLRNPVGCDVTQRFVGLSDLLPPLEVESGDE